MRSKKYFLQQSLFAFGLLLLFSCSNNNNQEKVVPLNHTKQVNTKSEGRFPFYKDIVVRPGLNFEVLSWGKGVDSLGGYLILMSDSIKNNYRSMAAERKGIVTDAWNMDLDNDGNPELYIELLSKKNVLDLNVYEYSGNDYQRITFPSLSGNIKKNYTGHDKFIIKNGDLFRSIPVVNSNTQKTESIKMLQYKLNGNSFSVFEVKEK